jgi:hypothetical protein
MHYSLRAISLLGRGFRYLYGPSINCHRINTELAVGDADRVHIGGRFFPT